MIKVKGVLAISMALAILSTMSIVNATASSAVVYSTTQGNSTVIPKKSADFYNNLANLTVNFTLVNTTYGQVNIPTDTIKKIGLENVLSKYYKIEKQDQELCSMEKQANISPNIIPENQLFLSPNSTANQVRTSLMYNDQYQERTTYSYTGTNHPMLLYGTMTPGTFSNSGDNNFISYLEREICGNNLCIELISCQHPDGTATISSILYDNNMNTEVDHSLFFISIPNVVHPIRYDVILSSVDTSYSVLLSDTVTGTQYYDVYVDSDDFTSYITIYTGSAEITDFHNWAIQFHTSCNIYDIYTEYVGETWPRLANTVFTNIVDDANNGNNQPFVYAHGYGDGSYTYSNLIAANPNPT